MLMEVGEIHEAEQEYESAVDALQQAAEYLAVSFPFMADRRVSWVSLLLLMPLSLGCCFSPSR